jgi:hypothetical protein
VDDRLPVRSLVMTGIALAVITVIQIARATPIEPLKLALIPVVIPIVVGTAYALVRTVRGFDRADPAAAIVGLLIVGGAFLASVGTYLLFFVVARSDTILPAAAPTMFMVGILMIFAGVVPLGLADIARDRALLGRRGAMRSVLALLMTLAIIALVLRVLVFGPFRT